MRIVNTLVQFLIFILTSNASSSVSVDEFAFVPPKPSKRFEEKAFQEILPEFVKAFDNVKCNDDTLSRGRVKSILDCKRNCAQHSDCKFYAFWPQKKYCETYRTCHSQSPDDRQSTIVVYRRLSDCETVFDTYTANIVAAFPGNSVRLSGENRNLHCNCVTNSWMICTVFVIPGSAEENVVRMKLDRNDENNMLPFRTMQSQGDQGTAPITYSVEGCEVFTEMEIMFPDRCISLAICASEKCPVQGNAFQSGDAVYILNSDLENIVHGTPVPCTSLTGLRTLSMIHKGTGFRDPFERRPDDLMLCNRDYTIMYVFGEKEIAVCQMDAFKKQKSSPSKKKKKKKGGTSRNSRDSGDSEASSVEPAESGDHTRKPTASPTLSRSASQPRMSSESSSSDTIYFKVRIECQVFGDNTGLLSWAPTISSDDTFEEAFKRASSRFQIDLETGIKIYDVYGKLMRVPYGHIKTSKVLDVVAQPARIEFQLIDPASPATERPLLHYARPAIDGLHRDIPGALSPPMSPVTGTEPGSEDASRVEQGRLSPSGTDPGSDTSRSELARILPGSESGTEPGSEYTDRASPVTEASSDATSSRNDLDRASPGGLSQYSDDNDPAPEHTSPHTSTGTSKSRGGFRRQKTSIRANDAPADSASYSPQSAYSPQSSRGSYKSAKQPSSSHDIEPQEHINQPRVAASSAHHLPEPDSPGRPLPPKKNYVAQFHNSDSSHDDKRESTVSSFIGGGSYRYCTILFVFLLIVIVICTTDFISIFSQRKAADNVYIEF